jgi:flagellar biosynthesis protein FliR
MKSRKILTSIKTVLSFIAFATVMVACDTEQGMMHGGGQSMNMGNWNWVQILIGMIIGFLLGYLVARRRK